MGTKDKKNVLIVALLIAVVFMSVGYALLSTQMEMDSSPNNQEKGWEVKISDLRILSTSGSTVVASNPEQVANLSAKFTATLMNPGDSVTYQVTVANTGSLNAMLKQYITDPENYSEDTYVNYEISGLTPNMLLNSQEFITFYVTATYNENAATPPLTEADATRDLSINLDFEQQ